MPRGGFFYEDKSGIFLILDWDWDFGKIKKFPEKNSLFFPTAISGTFYPTPPPESFACGMRSINAIK